MQLCLHNFNCAVRAALHKAHRAAPCSGQSSFYSPTSLCSLPLTVEVSCLVASPLTAAWCPHPNSRGVLYRVLTLNSRGVFPRGQGLLLGNHGHEAGNVLCQHPVHVLQKSGLQRVKLCEVVNRQLVLGTKHGSQLVMGTKHG